MRDHPDTPASSSGPASTTSAKPAAGPLSAPAAACCSTTSLPRHVPSSASPGGPTTPMVRIVRRVAGRAPRPRRPRLRLTTSTNQAAIPNNSAAPHRPPLDPTTRFGQPLLPDWTPKDQSPAHRKHRNLYERRRGRTLPQRQIARHRKLHPDASPITYQVPFEPGTLKAVARTNSKIVATDELRTAGKPARLVLTTGLIKRSSQSSDLSTNRPDLE